MNYMVNSATLTVFALMLLIIMEIDQSIIEKIDWIFRCMIEIQENLE